MLKLKKLQILGFKSFCDRTELKFHGDGVAAIIGPNGCGKSNIADAISWVLGEQSAKTLRGSRMDDVIFAGTRDRKPTGMAEVSLSLIDPEVYPGADAHEPTEVEIQEDMPTADDWDESEIRTRAAEETELLHFLLRRGTPFLLPSSFHNSGTGTTSSAIEPVARGHQELDTRCLACFQTTSSPYPLRPRPSPT